MTLLSLVAVTFGAVAAGACSYGAYLVVHNPRVAHRVLGPGVQITYHASVLRALGFLLPTLCLSVIFLAGAVVVFRERSKPPDTAARPGAAWGRWATQASLLGSAAAFLALAVSGIVAAVVSLVRKPDIGDDPAVLAGGAVTIACGLVVWCALTHLFSQRWRPRPRRVLLSLVVVGGLVGLSIVAADTGVGTSTVFSSPLRTGFRTVTIHRTPVFTNLDEVSCLDASHCVVLGSVFNAPTVGERGQTTDPLVGNVGAGVATSDDGGATWHATVLSNLLVTTTLTCAATSCQTMAARYDRFGADAPLVPVGISVEPDGTPTVTARPPGAAQTSGGTVCTATFCLTFRTVAVKVPPPGAVPPAPGQEVLEALAVSSNEVGQVTSSTPLPIPPRLSGSAPGASAVLEPFGPWCTDGQHCLGAEVVVSKSCVNSTSLGCPHQLTMLVTSDAGRTWTTHTLPVDAPLVESVTCQSGGICTGTPNWPFPSTSFVVSDDDGAQWSAPEKVPPPYPAAVVQCWSAAGCVAATGTVYSSHPTQSFSIVSTTDGGRTWARQRIDARGVTFVQRFWCAPTGRCVATAATATGPVVLTRAAPESPWVAHRLGRPRPVSVTSVER